MNGPVLEAHQLSIGYASRQAAPRVVAAGLDLALHGGELACLIGPNGVGKSTLLRTLAGMQPALAGHVRLGGSPIETLTAAELARRLSVVLTERVDAGRLTADELVALGRYPYTSAFGRSAPRDHEVTRWALEAVGALGLAQREMHELSDGERQRVMIARALAQEPLVMLLDEPTAFLDLPRRVEMMRLLRRLARETDRALLLSTHDLDLALRSADTLWLMAPGGTLRWGAPEDLVLGGAFEATFAGDGIGFDRRQGTFELYPPGRRRASLDGDGITASWTARALERCGFSVVGAAEAASVRVVVHAATSAWDVTLPDGTPRQVQSLQELAALLS